MPEPPRLVPDATNEPSAELEVLGMLLANAEAAIQLVDAATAPSLHIALLNLIARLGYEIEEVVHMGRC